MIDIHKYMPISLILTTFYHFHFRLTLGLLSSQDLTYCLKGIVLNSRELIFSLNRTLVGSDVLCKIQAAGGMAVDHNMSMYELNFISTIFDEWTLLC